MQNLHNIYKLQCQFKTGAPQGGVFHQHYSTFTLQTYHQSEHRFRSWPTQRTSPSPSHLHTQAQVQPRNTYNHTYSFAWTKQNNLTLNPDKPTCTLFTPDPAEYKSNLDLKINNTALPMATHPKVLGLTLDPKLTYSTYIQNISMSFPKITAYKQWNCQVIRPANCCHLIPLNGFFNGFPGSESVCSG